MTDTASKGITPSATVGPYFAYGLTPNGRYAWKDTGSAAMAAPGTEGTPVRIEGRVLDGDGVGIPDAMIEVWQADSRGRYDHARATGSEMHGSNTGFSGWGRVDTAADGGFALMTIKPGVVAGAVPQAPHLLVAVFARGLLRHLYTRIYFPEDAGAQSTDAILQAVPASRRATLIARPKGPGVLTFDIRLQGGDETVFFDL
jgi:protocatechuate 3,4-dioxygenase, alpha subunit